MLTFKIQIAFFFSFTRSICVYKTIFVISSKTDRIYDKQLLIRDWHPQTLFGKGVSTEDGLKAKVITEKVVQSRDSGTAFCSSWVHMLQL